MILVAAVWFVALAIIIALFLLAVRLPKMLAEWQKRYDPYSSWRLFLGQAEAKAQMAQVRSMRSRWANSAAATFLISFIRTFLLFIASFFFLLALLAYGAVSRNGVAFKVFDFYGGKVMPVIMGILVVLLLLTIGSQFRLRSSSDIPLIRVRNMTVRTLSIYLSGVLLGEVAPGLETENRTVSAYHPTYPIEAKDSSGARVYLGEFTLEELEERDWMIVVAE